MTKEQHEVGATARNLAVVVRVARATAAAIALTEVNPATTPAATSSPAMSTPSPARSPTDP